MSLSVNKAAYCRAYPIMLRNSARSIIRTACSQSITPAIPPKVSFIRSYTSGKGAPAKDDPEYTAYIHRTYPDYVKALEEYDKAKAAMGVVGDKKIGRKHMKHLMHDKEFKKAFNNLKKESAVVERDPKGNEAFIQDLLSKNFNT